MSWNRKGKCIYCGTWCYGGQNLCRNCLGKRRALRKLRKLLLQIRETEAGEMLHDKK